MTEIKYIYFPYYDKEEDSLEVRVRNRIGEDKGPLGNIAINSNTNIIAFIPTNKSYGKKLISSGGYEGDQYYTISAKYKENIDLERKKEIIRFEIEKIIAYILADASAKLGLCMYRHENPNLALLLDNINYDSIIENIEHPWDD